MIGRMVEAGFLFCETARRVDVMILNTCGFLNDARNEARAILESLLVEKAEGRIATLIVTGCAVQHEREVLVNEFPEVDYWFGVFDEFRIGDIARRLLDKTNIDNDDGQRIFLSAERKTLFGDAPRHCLTLPHVAYLKIADGCSRLCSYCLIPKIRGAFASRPKEQIIDEAKRLADAGIRELVIIAQETNFWGLDLYGHPMLAELLAELQNISSIDWLRLMYMYPAHFSDALIDQFASGGKLLPYIDLPLQHCNDEILRKMNRKATKSETETLLGKLRDRIPQLVMRSSFITGFPGETDTMFDELLAFVQTWRFERAGVFQYSREEGTPAAAMPDQIDASVKAERYHRLYELTETQTHEWASRQVGQRLDVLIDQQERDETGRQIPGVFVGRTYADAPTIDPAVIITSQTVGQVAPGQIVPCEIVMTHGVDLIAVPVDPISAKPGS
jgi:ribosomal protein S12 methylthiotransferase